MYGSLTDLKPEVKAVRSQRGAIIWFSFYAYLKLQELEQILKISGKLGTSPMDQELCLWGSLLPHREDSIPKLDPLLAHVLKFEYFL